MIKSGIGKWGLMMMFLIIGIFVFLSSMAFASEWAKAYGGSNRDWASSIQQTSDGGYIVAGVFSTDGGTHDYTWVLKFDANGNVVWQKTYGDTSVWNIANSIQQTTDGGYIVAGQNMSFSAGSWDVWVLKLDGNGNVQWQKTYGGTNEDEDRAFSIQQTTDGGYIVAGYTQSFATGDEDAWILKLDSSGNVQWQKTYGATGGDDAYSIQQTSDGGYIVAGVTDSFGAGSGDTWILKLDSSGNVQWQKTYGATDADGAYSIQQTTDGGYIVVSMTRSFIVDGQVPWLLKLDSNGNIQWQKTYGGTSVEFSAYSILQTSDGGYIVAGDFHTTGTYPIVAWVLKLDSNGNIQWQKTYGGTYEDAALSIQQTTDGGYIVGGRTSSFSVGREDILILKLDSSGNIHDCSIIKTSNAQVNNTDATVQDTNVTGVDTNVSPQTSTVTVTDTNAVVTELCKYGCNLVPDTTSVHRGGTLGFQATGTNYTNNTGTAFFATKVTKPDGNLSGFLFGPRSIYWGSYESKSGHLLHTIPSNAPLGLYTYYGYIGNSGIGNYSKCQFDFTVTGQGQGCNLCHQ